MNSTVTINTNEYYSETLTSDNRVVVIENDMIEQKPYTVHVKINGGDTYLFNRKVGSLAKAQKLARFALNDYVAARTVKIAVLK